MIRTFTGKIVGVIQDPDGRKCFARFQSDDGVEEIQFQISTDLFYAIKFDTPVKISIEYNRP